MSLYQLRKYDHDTKKKIKMMMTKKKNKFACYRAVSFNAAKNRKLNFFMSTIFAISY